MRISMKWPFAAVAAAMLAVGAMNVQGCGSKDDKAGCNESCSSGDDCKSGYACLDGSGGKTCVPSQCSSCSTSCVFSAPNSDKECTFTKCSD